MDEIIDDHGSALGVTARIVIVTGTGTDVGKTVVTAAVAALAREAGRRVAVVKPAQTGMAPGERGDLAEVTRLAGVTHTVELARYPDPLAPATAARRAGAPALTAGAVVAAVAALDVDLVLVEGAGGLLVRLNDDGETLADVALGLRAARDDVAFLASGGSHDSSLPEGAEGEGAPATEGAGVLLVASAGLGVLNHAALTAEALARRGLLLLGTVVGAWPTEPDLAARTNLDDLPRVTGAPLLGVLPDGAAADPDRFSEVARCGLGPALGGRWSPQDTT